MTIDAADAVEKLHAMPLQEIRTAPKLPGIYALADHEHRFRYIGSTEGKDFDNRVKNRHVTGSEENSHKFSWAYNCGRMYRGPETNDPQIERDRKAAKNLRTAFIRRYCRAVFWHIDAPAVDLLRLEKDMIWAAPLETVLWNRERIKTDPYPEPTLALNAFLADFPLQPDVSKSIARQHERYKAMISLRGKSAS